MHAGSGLCRRGFRAARSRTILLAAAAATLLGGAAQAHTFTVTETVLVLKSDGTFQADLTVDVDALALGVSPTVPSEELAAALRGMSPAELQASIDRAVETMQRRVRIRFDDRPVDFHVAFPHRNSPLAEISEEATVLGILARLSGRIPADATEVTFFASRAFGVVRLTIFDQESVTAERHLLGEGEESPPHVLGAEPASTVPPLSRDLIVGQYLVLGFEHILPKGLDHILFVLGLFLLSTRMRPLLWQITAFTIAHSVTLALSMFDVVSLPPRLVETLIALSIVYVAVENVVTSELKPWRPAVVFGFGMLHGLGFAGVLRELGLPRDEFLPALFAFNVGVEAGQIAVVLLAFAVVGWFRHNRHYRTTVVVPASLLIAAVGLYWSFERALPGI